MQFESRWWARSQIGASEDGGWRAREEDQTAGSAMQMADEYFARALTSHGGLGLARMISNSLDQASANAAANAASRSNPGRSRRVGSTVVG